METNDLTTSVDIYNASGAEPTPPQKLTYSAAEAAALLGVSRPTIYRLIARRVLIPIPGLRHKRIPKKQVHRLEHPKGCTGLF
jgi:excisionase family DNA binding protein